MAEEVELSETRFPKDALKRSKETYPPPTENAVFGSSILNIMLFNVANRIAPWGGSGQKLRDKQLRDFWPTEPFLAGAIKSVCTRNANMEWEIEGPNPRMVTALTDMIISSMANNNFGWMEFIKCWSQDYFTQDNGAFIELIRDPSIIAGSNFKRENAPIVGLNHLDAAQCLRTGNPDIPVIYSDPYTGGRHKMKWYEIVPLAEFASPIKKMHGIGYCAISRILKMAEIIQSVQIYTDEKVSGRFTKEIHIVSGVGKQQIEDVQKQHEERLDNQGLARFAPNMILASLDPEKPVTSVTIPLGEIPENFDFEELMRWYISEVALNTGQDYQDLAPLPTSNIGSGEQSEILHRKSRGKGEANFMETWQSLMRNYGIVPRPYVFKFMTKDLSDALETAQMKREIITALSIARRTDFIDGTTARKILVKYDVFDEEDLTEMEEDYGNEEMSSKNENPLGQVGDNTVDQDANRTEKSIGSTLKKVFSRGSKD